VDNHIRIQNSAYHRNGISGLGFHVVLFQWHDDESDVERQMVAVCRPQLDKSGRIARKQFSPDIAVFDVNELREGNIAMARGNSWRGDHFEGPIREYLFRKEQEEIKTWRATR